MTFLPYRPYPLLKNGHLQTMLVGLISGERPPYCATPIVIPLSDGESLVVHEEEGGPISPKADLVILLHGLGGCHRSAYLERLAPTLRASGFLVWRVDLRGCGAGIKHAWKPPNAGRSDDLAEVVNAATTRYPNNAIHVVGFSLSGNIVLKMLGEAGVGRGHLDLSSANLRSAVAIAPPANLHDCSNNMDRFSRKIYTWFYLKTLDEQVQDRRARWPRWNRVARAPKIKTIRQFDARYTAPLSGFADADDYYTRSSALDVFPHIKTPTEIIVDKDDPIVTAKLFDQAELSKSTSILPTRYGGHMGYYGVDEQGKMIRWLEYYILQKLKMNRLQ